MAAPEFRQVLRFFAITGLVGICLLVSNHLLGGHAAAKALAQPLYQEGYPGITPITPGPDIGYPGITPLTPDATGSGTAPAASTTPSPGLTVTVTSGPTQTPLNTLTPTATSVNFFLTENAEMGGSSITPPASLTPEGTGTIAATPTETSTRTPLTTLISGSESEGKGMDWGLFWIGFAVPFIAACGVVLYLLDRRPELFSLKRK